LLCAFGTISPAAAAAQDGVPSPRQLNPAMIAVPQLSSAFRRSAPIAVAAPAQPTRPVCGGGADRACDQALPIAAPPPGAASASTADTNLVPAPASVSTRPQALPDPAVVAERLGAGDISGSAGAQAAGGGFGAPPSNSAPREERPRATPDQPRSN
jgi:hypothetical protein